MENYSFNSIWIGGEECNLAKNLTLGMNEIDISFCLENLDSKSNDIVILTSKGTVKKSVYLDNINFSYLPMPIVSFSSNVSNVEYGESINLSWSSSNADNCSAFGDWSGDKDIFGNVVLNNLVSSKTYTLTCEGEGGNISDSVIITVGSQDIIPNVFSFGDLVAQEISSVVVSESVILDGFDGPVTATISGDGGPE